MIDCGEGTQLQMRKYHARMSRLHSIFISHLHGDHVFGLPGLISTLNLLGRTGDLNIYAHKEIDIFLKPMLAYFCPHLAFKINLLPLDNSRFQLIYENKSMRVFSFPLKHRIPTCGFLFEEKEAPRHIKREMIDFYGIPLREIQHIKAGNDFIAENGTLIPNDILTYAATPSRRYAYCSDTAFFPDIIPHINQVNALYHEATFADSEIVRAHETFHSTAREAGQIAKSANVRKLIIGHYSSRYTDSEALLKEAQSVFPETELAFEGKIIEI